MCTEALLNTQYQRVRHFETVAWRLMHYWMNELQLLIHGDVTEAASHDGLQLS